jgi:hypothetical protein
MQKKPYMEDTFKEIEITVVVKGFFMNKPWKEMKLERETRMKVGDNLFGIRILQCKL